MEMSIGIDLGTTNTAVSIARRGVHGTVEVETEKIVQIGEDGITPNSSDELLPSVLYIDESATPYVGQVAKAMKSQKRKRVVSNSKNFMGMQNYKWQIEEREYTPEIVASHLLRAVRNFLKNKYINEDLLKSAVITVPASFDIDQRRATKTAARLAGFKDSKITLISEPTAAMLDFINEQRKFKDESKTIDFSGGRNILVFDLGGGTCDVSILSIEMLGDKVDVEEIEVSPHTLVGGTNFDAYAALGIIKDFNKINNVKLEKLLNEETFKELENELMIKCEKAKLFFSGRYENIKNLEECDRKSAIESLKFPIAVANILNGKPLIYDLSMKRYDEFISPLLKDEVEAEENIIRPIKKTLSGANMTIDDIDYIFCVGGMTMYPAVTRVLKEFFNKDSRAVLNKMNSVSRGAAVYHYYNVSLSKRDHKENVIDIIPRMPQSVFLNVKGGLPITLIEEKTKAGTPRIHNDIVKVNSEIGVELELYAGKSVFDPELKRLKNVKLAFTHGVKKGSLISLKAEYTSSGMLNLESWLTNDKSVKIDVCIDDLVMTNKEIEDTRNKYNLGKVRGVY